MDTDWTPIFRAWPSVQQYLVIGEGPYGCTGTDAVFDPPTPWQIRYVPGFSASAARRTDLPTLGSRTNAWLVTR